MRWPSCRKKHGIEFGRPGKRSNEQKEAVQELQNKSLACCLVRKFVGPRWLCNGSRMTGDCHVRFCEEVRLKCLALLSYYSAYDKDADPAQEQQQAQDNAPAQEPEKTASNELLNDSYQAKDAKPEAPAQEAEKPAEKEQESEQTEATQDAFDTSPMAKQAGDMQSAFDTMQWFNGKQTNNAVQGLSDQIGELQKTIKAQNQPAPASTPTQSQDTTQEQQPDKQYQDWGKSLEVNVNVNINGQDVGKDMER